MVVNKDISVRGLKLTLRSRGLELESPQGLTKYSMPTTLYSSRSPAQSTTSLSEDDDDELDKSLYIVEPASPTRWTKEEEAASLHTIHAGDRDSIVLRLPPEVIIHIFKQLHNPRDLLSCLLVSRSWAACSVELLWHKPHFPRSTSLYQMVSVLSRSPQDLTFTYPMFVRRLNFLQMGQDLTSSVFVRLAACQRLERLTLNNCGGIADDALVSVLPCWPQLVALDLTNVSETTDRAVIAFANAARRLQGLNLSGCKNVTDEGIIAIAKSSPQLRRIKLGHLEAITDKSVITLAESCSLLLEVDLNGCTRITDACVRDIWTHSVHMREFRLSGCPNLTDSAFPAPPSSLSGLDPFPGSTPLPSQQWPPLELKHPFDHLRILDLTSCANITDDAIEGIVSNARKIRNLVLGKCIRLTDAALESICKLGKSLHYLHLGHAQAITDRSVTKLARSCLRLRYIDLACCPLLTDLSVFELASLPKLRRIGLVRVINLTDQAVMNLGEQRRHTLERIHLSYCEQITVPAIHFLLQKVTKLTHLSLTGVPSFRHNELQQFCRPAPREFNVTQRAAFCVYSNDGVRELRKYLQNILPAIGNDDVNESYDRDEDQTPVYQSGYVEDSEQDEYSLAHARSSQSQGGSHNHEPEQRSVTTIPASAANGRTTNRLPRRRHSLANGFGVDTVAIGTNSAGLIVETNDMTHNPFEWHGEVDVVRRTNRPSRNHNHTHALPNGDRSFAHVTTRRPHPPAPASGRSGSGSNPGSARSSQSNGVSFMNSYDPVAMQMQADLRTMNGGTATPELVFAELGHGPGMGQGGPGPSTMATRLDSQLPIHEDQDEELEQNQGAGKDKQARTSVEDGWVVEERPDTPIASTSSAAGHEATRGGSSANTTPQNNRHHRPHHRHHHHHGHPNTTHTHHRRPRGAGAGGHASVLSSSPARGDSARRNATTVTNTESSEEPLQSALGSLSLHSSSNGTQEQWESDDNSRGAAGRRPGFSAGLISTFRNVGLLSPGRHGSGGTSTSPSGGRRSVSGPGAQVSNATPNGEGR